MQQKLTHKVAVLRFTLSRYSWLLCILSTQFTSEYNYSTFDKTKPITQQGIHPLTLKCTIWKDSEDMIQSLNQLHYITSDQSHSVKARKIQPLAKPFRLFSRVCENCIIKTNVQSHLL